MSTLALSTVHSSGRIGANAQGLVKEVSRQGLQLLNLKQIMAEMTVQSWKNKCVTSKPAQLMHPPRHQQCMCPHMRPQTSQLSPPLLLNQLQLLLFLQHRSQLRFLTPWTAF